MTTKGATDAELWRALARLEDDFLDPSLPDAVLDAELKVLGVDAEELVRRGVSFVGALMEEQRLSWQAAAQERQAEMARRAAQVEVSSQMDRGALLSRIEQLRATDPNVGTAIKMAARKRKPEESTDDELRSLLQEMETLRVLESDGDE
jgi:hypothetical protein